MRNSAGGRISAVAAWFSLTMAACPPAVRAQETATAPVATMPSYPNSTDGLRKFVGDLLGALKTGDDRLRVTMLHSLQLPDAGGWFQTAFGTESGAKMVELYAQANAAFPVPFSAPFILIFSEKLSNIEVVRFEKACDDRANGYEYPVLASFDQLPRVYSLRASNVTTHRQIKTAFFVYAGGAFRYLGNLDQSVIPQEPGSPTRLKVGGTVQASKLVRQARPHYPEEAKANHQQGTVKMNALISKEGQIVDLRLVEGTCNLSKAAIEAVRQWQYKPTLLNGDPVEILTSIEVTFTLVR